MNLRDSKLLAEAADLLPGAVRLRRRIHENPELGLDLPETTAAVLETLDGLDVEIVRSQKTSGLMVTLRGGKPGPTVLLRGDMDALPMPEDTGLEFESRNAGRMHACGHDAHTSMLAHAVHLLDRHRSDLRGDVVFMFQPGEEGYRGAKVMIDEGLLDIEGLEAAFAMHIAPQLPVGRVAGKGGAILAAADSFEIQVRGRGGHASMPHDTADPIPVACEIVQALQSFVTRRIDVFDPVVLTVARISAGTAGNVIPESAEMLGTLRSTSERARKRAQEGIDRVARQIAAAHELEAEVTLVEGYPVTVNDDGFAQFAASVTRDLLGESAWVTMPNPAMGAEDFSYVLHRVPGAMVLLGVRPEGSDHPAPAHSNRMQLNEDGMRVGIALHAAIALQFLEGRA
jgi:hippurate hydrolase